MKFKGRSFLRNSDFSRAEHERVFALAAELKAKQKKGEAHHLLAGKCLAMLFEKPSNRTRMSFEVGMYQLGGMALNVNAAEIAMGSREPIPDVARILSGYVDVVMIRAFHHWTIEEFAKHASVPVINGLSDHYHPCQAVADLFTIQEKRGKLEGQKLCYVGDGNNVCNSLVEICRILGVQITIACPEGYEPYFREENNLVSVVHDPKAAVKGADVVYTDVWVSMGQEGETARRLEAFAGYKVTPELMARAKKDAIFMHCLPAHRGLEVDERVLESVQSVVFEQAENRLHTQKAILALLLGGA